jgi:hypothetical protein
VFRLPTVLSLLPTAKASLLVQAQFNDYINTQLILARMPLGVRASSPASNELSYDLPEY